MLILRDTHRHRIVNSYPLHDLQRPVVTFLSLNEFYTTTAVKLLTKLFLSS